MIDRKEFMQEQSLRENIRRAIKIVKNRRKRKLNENMEQEDELRKIIRVFLKEGQAAVSTTAKHDSTGINVLEDLLKNTNILSVLEMGYTSLTTKDKDDPPEGATKQRKSYRNHILVAVEKSLAPEESRKEADEDVVEVTEAIDIAVGDNPEDDPAFIDVEEKEVVKDDDEVEKEEFAITGEDKTGRNKAFTDFQTISKVILRAYDDLDNPEDRNLFGEYLIKNVALYFDKFEAALAGEVEEPEIAADAEVDEPAVEPGDDEEIANIELQEVIKHLNIDDIIKNLL
tara:strand:- start:122 stop:979 length:858 start_codon:yes stop_codon:yes gene_type:complete